MRTISEQGWRDRGVTKRCDGDMWHRYVVMVIREMSKPSNLDDERDGLGEL